MTSKLKDYFPMIRTRNEVLAQIQSQPQLKEEFESWEIEQQEELLDFCTGAKGIKMTYDGFFKEIMNPEYYPERLERLLTLLLQQEVHIKQVLPNDSVRLADESMLLITDVVVQLADESFANVEIQRIGYLFPGERSACYSADLLLRQYKRVKGMRKEKFTYKDIKNVYVIVLFEKSTKEFRETGASYIHHSKQTFDTGLQINLLQEYIYISLDIFKENKHNRTIDNELEAWLAFLCYDEPEQIIKLVKSYPELKPMYEEVFNICQNVEGVIGMFSKELRQLDRNTERYMMEEQQAEIKEQRVQLKEQRAQMEEQQVQIKEQRAQMEEQRIQIKEQQVRMEKQQVRMEEQQVQIKEQQTQMEEQRIQIKEQQTQLELLTRMQAEMEELKLKLNALKE